MAMMQTMSPILDDIRKAIAASRKSRYVISQETGISQSHLSQFMAGTKGLSVEALERVAACLGFQIRAQRVRRRKGR